MPNVNLELQLKFLNDLDSALGDAMQRYAREDADKMSELVYMKQEVTRAREIVGRRMANDDDRSIVSQRDDYGREDYASVEMAAH